MKLRNANAIFLRPLCQRIGKSISISVLLLMALEIGAVLPAKASDDGPYPDNGENFYLHACIPYSASLLNLTDVRSVRIVCTEPDGTYQSFAYSTTLDPVFAAAYLSILQTALIESRTLIIWYTEAQTAGTTACDIDASGEALKCSTIRSLELK